jgi:hypothetical protein
VLFSLHLQLANANFWVLRRMFGHQRVKIEDKGKLHDEEFHS